MSADGYLEQINPELLSRYSHLQELCVQQQNIDAEIKDLSTQIEEMPHLPRNLDYWIGSFNSKFKLKDFSKMFKIKKRYEQLIEKREQNKNKIREFVIDGLLEQIKEVEKPKI